MKRFLSFLMVGMLLSTMAWAQSKVTGKVVDEAGDPLEGVAVLIKGTTMGTFTDNAGSFSLEVPESANTLVLTMVGRATMEQAITGSSLAITMATSDVTLDEVVVTALGISREKKSLGYATQEVGGDEVTKVKDVNFINSLSGKIAGVDIKRSSTLGGSANVIIRGYKSLTNNNQALFVVDGIPISNSRTNSGGQTTGRGGYDFGNFSMDINPEDIESINVLKGAAATALYGSRAANGVVQITTKKGTRRKGLGISVNSGLTMGSIDRTTFPTYQKEYGPGYSTIQGWYAENGYEYYDFGNGSVLSQAVYEDASFGPAFDPSVQAYDWRSYYPEIPEWYGQTFPNVAAEDDASEFYETMRTLNTSVSMEGGNEDGNFRLSYTNFDQKGIVPNSQIKRNTANLAAGYKLHPNLKISSTMNYIITEGRGRYGTGYDNRNPNQSFRQWYSTATSMADQLYAYEQTGKNISWNPYGPLDPNRATVPHYFDNYYFNAYENVPTDERNRFFGNVQMDWKITDWLSFLGRMSTDRYAHLQEERKAVGGIDVPSYSRYNLNFAENNLDLILSAEKYFGANEDLSLSGLVGYNNRRTSRNSVFAATNGGLVVPGLYSLSNSVNPINAPTEIESVIGVDGYYARFTAGFQRMLYLDVTGRYDVSSTLPAGENAYFYPSASLTFVFSELMNTDGAFTFGKLRANYAQVGNSAGFAILEDFYNLGTPFNGTPLASAPGTKNNPNLKPENTVSSEVGVELAFFENRLGLDVTAYNSNTFNQLIPVTTTGANGFTAKYLNAGQINNKGLEATLRATPVKAGGFQWDIAVNWFRNVNKVIELFGDQENLQLASVQGGITINATVGEPYGSIWGTNYVYHTDGSPIVYPHWNTGVRYRKTTSPEVIGNIQPDWKMGINNTFRFKDLSLSFLIDMQQGGQFFSLDTWYGYATGIYDFTAGTNSEGNPVRDLPGDGGGIFIDGAVVQSGNDPETGAPISGGTVNEEAFYSSDVYSSLGYVYAPNAYHVHDASFIKLREVNLSYNIPRSIVEKTPLKGLSISLIGRNLWIISKNAPYTDPEAGLSAGNIQGYQSGAYPMVREYGFNLGIKF
ncbi:MAG: SusC/RagA family TonB-linked outer membrane protein [Bacteroidota bacterium]